MRLFTSNIVRRFATSFTKNPYELLGVARGATEQEIKTAYFRLAKQYHPDLKPEYGEKFKQISEAYNILKDPTKRADLEALYNKVRHRDDINEIHKSRYDTRYHYGYTNKFAKEGQPNPNNYESNPFAHGYEKVFSNDFTRQMFRAQNEKRRKRNISSMNQSVKYVLVGILSFFGVMLVAEVMLNVYRFNHYNQKQLQTEGNQIKKTKLHY